MLLEITFENEMCVLTPHYTQLGEEVVFHGVVLPPDEEMNQVASTLPILNNCLKKLSVAIGEKEEVLNRESMLTFVDEVVLHKEYCTSQMLLFFEDYLSFSLGDGTNSPNLWADATRQNNDAREKGLTNSATTEDIQAIYNAMHDGGLREHYYCRTDSPMVLLIQVVYSILLHTFRRGHIIKRCDRCGNIFIPTRPSDKYCLRRTDGKTCGQISKEESQKRSHNKEEKKLYKRIDNRLLQQGEFSTIPNVPSLQNDFRTGFRQCVTEEERKAYLEEWNEKTYKRKPKK